MQKKKVIGFILMLIAILIISFGGRSTYAAGTPKIMERESGTYVTGTGEVFYAIGAKRAGKTKYTADLISSITLVTNKNVPSSAEASWDASYTSGSNEVIAWVVQNSTDTTKYDLYIGSSSSNIEAPSNSHGLFRNYTNCVNINNLKILTTQNITDAGYMFFSCNALTSLDLQNFVTTNITRMNLMFSYCTSLVNLDLSGFNTSKVINMRSMFDGSKNLTSLDLSNFDTRNVTDIAIMFYGCNNLESVNLSSFDTTKVTDMYRMFYFCTSLKNLDLSNFRTPSATNMGNMFYNCNSLTSLDVSNFDTTNVTNMEKMFRSCSKLTSLDLSNFKTPNATNMTEMFYNCNSLTSIDVSNFDTKNISDMSGMFYYCSSLTKLDLSNFRTLNVTNMANMFFYCRSLTNLDVSTFDTTNVTNMEKMFHFCEKLTSLNLSNFKTPNVTNMTEMFYNCNSLTNLDVSNFDTKNISDMSGMFYYCSSLKNLDLSNFRTPSATNMGNMFYNCNSLTSLDVSNFDTTNVTNMEKMFRSCSKLTSLDLSNFKTPNLTNMANMFYYCQSLTSLDISNFDTQKISDMSSMFCNCSSLTSLDLGSFRTPNVTNMAYMFYYCTSLTSLNVSNFDTTNVTSMLSMFDNCRSLTSLNLSNFDTMNVTDMTKMFNNCQSLTSLNLSNFDTTNVTDMTNMFNNCQSLTSLNLSGFNTANVTKIGYLFYECNSLKTLDLESFNTSKMTDMSAMFYDCKNLESLNVSSFDTSNVTNMEGMFYGCHSLGSLDLSGFNTSNVTNMQGMFYECKKIKHLNLSGFDTSKTTNMQGLFYDCSEIISLDISNFDTSKVTNMAYMFYNCSNLKSIILDKEITSSDQAMKLLTNTLLNMLPNAILYVPNAASEKLYEAATNYSTTFKDSRDANGDLYRIRPILEIAGENPAKIVSGGTYDATNDAGVKIAGFDKTDESVYTQYGYNYTTSGLPVDTTSTGTKQVTYTLTKTKDGTTINGMSVTRNIEILEAPKLMERETYDYINGKGNVYYAIGAKRSGNTKYTADLISSITFVANKNVPSTAEASWDVSYTSGDGDVIAWVIPNVEDSTKYDLYIGTNDTTIQAPANPNNLFVKYKICTAINNLTILDTSKVTDMTWMFSNCSNLTSLDLSSFNTSKVTNMGSMFYSCSNLTSLDLSNFDTSKVTDMGGMFDRCSSLINLDVSNFDTSKVTDMAWMFYNCSKLTSLDLSSFNTSSVTYMDFMFYNCSKLTSLDLSNFNTSNVTNMSNMFYECESLTTLDVSKFNTSKVTNMHYMFRDCSELTNLDVSNFDTSKVTDMGGMFDRCSSLINLDVSKFDTSNVTNMSYMFDWCRKLTSLDVSNFDTSKVTNMSSMFYYCSKLTSLDVSNFNTSKVTDMSSMFDRCSNLTSLDVSKFDTTNVTNMESMFSLCSNLTSLDVNNFNTSNVTNMGCMFNYCGKLTNLNLSNFDTSNVTNMENMFSNCSKLTNLDVSKLNTSNVTNMRYMFTSCSNLTSLDVSNFNTSNVTNMYYMFKNCRSLTNLDVSKFDTSKVTDMGGMFDDCSSLINLDASNFNTSNVTNMGGMFDDCSKLTSLDVSGFDTSKVKSMGFMFNNCNSLKNIDLRSFDTSSLDGKTYSVLSSTVLGVDVNYMFSGCENLESIIIGDKFNRLDGYGMFLDCNKLKAIITTKTITTSSDAPTLSGTENVTNSNGKIIAGPNGLINLPNAILYVSDTASEKLYEAATNYATIFADSRDANGDLYRIRPILEVAGENPVKVKVGGTYNAKVDAGVTVAGFGVADSGEYTQYGYNYTTSGLPVDTTSAGTKQVTYTLTKTENGTTTNGMTATRDVKVTEAPKLMERDYDTINGIKYANYAIGAKRAGKTKYKKDLISTITLVSNKNVPTTAEASWDVSYTNGSNEVIAWVIPNATDSIKYDLYIGADDTSIQAPANSVDLFSNYTNCTEINNLEMLDTSKVTSMMYMFNLCNNLTKVNVTNFDTSKVTTMYGMFGYCSKLTSLDVSKFNTSNVTNMFAMFGSCRSLTSLDVTSFDTSKVTSMLCMFTDCSSLTSLDLSNFNTSNVTDMKEMFRDCSSLKELDLSSFDTAKVTTMNAMFCNCSSLTNLNVSSFNTSKVTDMSLMFASCRSLPALDLSKFNTSNVTTFAAMFSTCSSLENLNLATFDTRNARTIGFMFYNCSSLTNVVVTGTNFRFTKLDHTTAGVTGTYESLDINCVFAKCSSLTGIDLSSWNITTSENMNELFADCTNLKSIVLGRNFAALKGADMFKNCDNLRAIITKRTTPLTLATGTGAETVGVNNPKVLYVETKQLESSFESASNYASVFGADRIRPILGVAGENPVKVKIGETYDATVDAGATIAGFGVTDGGEYTQYGYNYTTVGLPVDTTSVGTKQVTYTLTKTENGTTTNGMTATRDVKVVGVPMLMERESSDYINKQNVYYAIGAKRSGNTKYTADLISTITFVNNTNIPTTAEANWDVSFTSGDNEVIAWVIPNATDSTKYDLYIGTDSETVEAPGNSYNLFGFYKECTEINNLTILDTSKVTDMDRMFSSCSSLINLDLNSFDTSNVTNMSHMFSNCNKLTSLNLENFNTSKVTVMSLMFYDCESLTSLEVSNFDTSNVRNMSHMFSRCKALISLDVSGFNTSKVTDMSSMFYNCSNLTSLDVSNFDTSNVTNMGFMFYWCSKLANLDVSELNTSKVTNMSYMFDYCKKLTSLDVSNFDTSNVTDMRSMFNICSNLTSLDVSNFDTSNVTDMRSMFYNCSNLTSLDVNNFNTSNVTNMGDMFSNCSKLTSLDVSGFDTSKVKTMGFMFNFCTNLKNIDLRSFDTSSLDGKTYNLTTTALGVDVNYMFSYCGNLESIIIGDKFNRLDGYDMFRGCNKLKAIITTKTITTSSDAPTLSGTENVTNSNGKIIAGPNGLKNLPNAILYVPDTASEKFYEAATNYATIFADSRYTEGDLYRVRPILEVAGENPVKVKIGETYDATVDAGATIAGFGVADSGEYTQYGYNYTTSGLPVDTTSVGTKQVTYTLTKTENGTTTTGMTATRDVEIVAADITGSVSISGDCVYGETLIVDTSKILPENADLEYKWYINDTNSTTGGTLVKEANSDSGLGNRYFISGDAIDKYVYVEVIASLENYTTKTFTDVVGPVQRADINRVDASLIHDIFVYDGNPKEPEVYVVDLRGPGDLTLGEDYTLEYKDNVNVGTGKVIVKGINKYTGELELTFKIIKAPEFELVNLTPEWTTSNVSIAINILDVGAGIKKVLFENEEVTLQNNTTTVVVDKNGLYTAEVFDIYGNAVVKELYVGNIDREVPVIEEVKYDGVTFAKEVKVEVKATDTGSGVYAYAVSEKGAEPTTWTQITPVENMTIFNFTISSNGTYYLFVKDAVGNITKYNKQIVITNIDNAPPVIKLFNIIDDYTFTTEVFIEINAEDDTGVEGLLLSNEMLTNSQVEDSDNWVPYTETVLYSLPSKDGNHTVYAWVRDSVGKISEYAQDNTLLLNKYVGNNGINNTSFKFLVKDENYNFAKKITESNIKILVKDDSDKVTYSTEYGVNITSISLPVVYGPAQEGTQMMTGEYYTITVENIGGKGTVYLVFDENSVVDKAGNKLANTEIKTDVEVELNTPKITLGTTEIQVSDPDGNLIQAIKVNGKTVLLTSGKITYEKLKTEYGITLKTDDTIEAFDKHSNSVMVTVQ